MGNKKLINIKVYSYKNSFNMPSNEGDAGHDLRYYGEAFTLKKHSIKKIRLQIRSILPKEYYVELAAKSGLASKGITTIGNIIDSGYTGYWHVILVNCSDEDYIFNDGDKVCQALIRQHNNIKLNLVAENEIENYNTERGSNGFGSTGK